MVLKYVLNHRWHFPLLRLADWVVVDRRVGEAVQRGSWSCIFRVSIVA